MNIGAEEKWTHRFLSVFSSFHGPFDCYEAPNDVLFAFRGPTESKESKERKGKKDRTEKPEDWDSPGKRETRGKR